MIGRCLNLCFSSFPILVILSFYPSQALDVGLSFGFVGLMMCLYSVAGLIISYLHPIIIIYFPKHLKFLKVFFNLMLIFSCIIFAILPKINNKLTFIILSIFARMIQGFAHYFIFNVAYGDIAIYTHNNENLYIKYIGFIEISVYIGDIGSSLYGGAFTKLMGYENMFFLLSFLIFISMIADLIEEKFFYHKIDEFYTNVTNGRDIDYFKIFKNFQFLGIFLLGVFNASSLEVIYTGFAINLKETLNFSLEDSSIISSIVSISGCIFSYFYGLIDWKIGKQLHIQIGSILIALGLLLIGPAPFLQSDIFIIFSGLIILGIGGVFGSLSLIIIFKEHIEKHYEFCNSDEVNAISASLYNSIWCISAIYGYITSGFVLNYFNYRLFMSMYGIFILILSVLYFIFWKGYIYFKNQFINKNENQNSTEILLGIELKKF